MEKPATNPRTVEAPVFSVFMVAGTQPDPEKENALGQECVFGQNTELLSKNSATQCYTPPCSPVNQPHRVAGDWLQRRYPRPGSVRGRILGALLRGDSLTQHEALRRFHGLRLAADVHKLRGNGWNIMTEPIDVTTLDAGRHAEVAKYMLPPDDIEAAGDEGREYAGLCAKIERGGA